MIIKKNAISMFVYNEYPYQLIARLYSSSPPSVYELLTMYLNNFKGVINWETKLCKFKYCKFQSSKL